PEHRAGDQRRERGRAVRRRPRAGGQDPASGCMNFQRLTQRFARLTTDIVVRRPRFWFLLRPLTRFQFDRLAPQWDSLRASETAYAPYEAALEHVDPSPKRALDLGTGTGGAAFAVARRFPGAEVVGADLAERMIERARANLTDDLKGRVRFEVGDGSKLSYGAGAVDPGRLRRPR